MLGSGLSTTFLRSCLLKVKHIGPFAHFWKGVSSSPSLMALSGVHSDAASLIPCPDHSLHKGECGCVGVVGGCDDYTGAPYFAAISTLKMGGDLVRVICTPSAAIPIKSYSPELMVSPLLGTLKLKEDADAIFTRLHSCVIGPGLGRDPAVLNSAKKAVEKMKELNKPVVLDADGLHLVTSDVDLIRDYPKAILTPNQPEFVRLYKAVIGTTLKEVSSAHVRQLAKSVGVTIVYKGYEDVICNPFYNGDLLVGSTGELTGSPRRAGGQGDVLSGAMALFAAWADKLDVKSEDSIAPPSTSPPPFMLAAYGACSITKVAAHRAYGRLGRSTLASDIIHELGGAVEDFRLKRLASI